jgi:transcriptional regulator with XRE-family HTH domain
MTNPMQHRNRRSDEGYLERDTAHDYRQAFGAYLRRCRMIRPEKIGGPITQEELANKLGLSHSAISAIEVGRSSLPPERLADVADILGVDRQDFSKTYLRWTNPWVYQLLLEPTDKKLQKELERIQPRVGLDVFKKPAKR